MPVYASTGRASASVVIKGEVDASLEDNLPSNPSVGDKYYISEAGNFDDSSLILPSEFDFEKDDTITWNGANWIANDSGDDDLKKESNLSDLDNAATARTNLDVDSKAEVTGKVNAHNEETQAHGISAFGASLVDDENAATARMTLGIDSESATKGQVFTADGEGGGSFEDVETNADIAASSFTPTNSSHFTNYRTTYDGDVTITLPSDLGDNLRFIVRNTTGDSITFAAGTGATITSENGLICNDNGGIVAVEHVSDGNWYLNGQLVTS